MDLEKHSQLRSELDSFSVGKTKSHVIIEHSVHVFNPDSVDGTVKDDPFTLLNFCLFGAFSHDDGNDTIGPTLGVWIEFTIQLIRSN